MFWMFWLSGLVFFPALDDGDLVVVVEVDDFLPEHPALILQPLKLLAAVLVLELLLADGGKAVAQLLDLSLDVVQRLINGVLLLI
jgi:hypothetical protein